MKLILFIFLSLSVTAFKLQDRELSGCDKETACAVCQRTAYELKFNYKTTSCEASSCLNTCYKVTKLWKQPGSVFEAFLNDNVGKCDVCFRAGFCSNATCVQQKIDEQRAIEESVDRTDFVTGTLDTKSMDEMVKKVVDNQKVNFAKYAKKVQNDVKNALDEKKFIKSKKVLEKSLNGVITADPKKIEQAKKVVAQVKAKRVKQKKDKDCSKIAKRQVAKKAVGKVIKNVKKEVARMIAPARRKAKREIKKVQKALRKSAAKLRHHSAILHHLVMAVRRKGGSKHEIIKQIKNVVKQIKKTKKVIKQQQQKKKLIKMKVTIDKKAATIHMLLKKVRCRNCKVSPKVRKAIIKAIKSQVKQVKSLKKVIKKLKPKAKSGAISKIMKAKAKKIEVKQKLKKTIKKLVTQKRNLRGRLTRVADLLHAYKTATKPLAKKNIMKMLKNGVKLVKQTKKKIATLNKTKTVLKRKLIPASVKKAEARKASLHILKRKIAAKSQGIKKASKIIETLTKKYRLHIPRSGIEFKQINKIRQAIQKQRNTVVLLKSNIKALKVKTAQIKDKAKKADISQKLKKTTKKLKTQKSQLIGRLKRVHSLVSAFKKATSPLTKKYILSKLKDGVKQVKEAKKKIATLNKTKTKLKIKLLPKVFQDLRAVKNIVRKSKNKLAQAKEKLRQLSRKAFTNKAPTPKYREALRNQYEKVRRLEKKVQLAQIKKKNITRKAKEQKIKTGPVNKKNVNEEDEEK